MERHDWSDGIPTLLSLCLDALTRHPPDVSACARQEEAKEAGGSFWRSCERSDDEPRPLVQLPLSSDVKAASLERLRVSGLLRDETLLLLLDDAVTSLNLSSCRQLSGDSLSLLPGLCPHLLALDLSWCCQLRGPEIEHLSLPLLRALSLRGCFRLSTGSIAALLCQLPSLAAVRLTGLEESAEVLLRHVAESNPRLRTLECHGLNMAASILHGVCRAVYGASPKPARTRLLPDHRIRCQLPRPAADGRRVPRADAALLILALTLTLIRTLPTCRCCPLCVPPSARSACGTCRGSMTAT